MNGIFFLFCLAIYKVFHSSSHKTSIRVRKLRYRMYAHKKTDTILLTCNMCVYKIYNILYIDI